MDYTDKTLAFYEKENPCHPICASKYNLWIKKTVSSASSVPKNKKTNNNQKKITTMENQKESVWSKVLRIVITILTAIATSLGVQSCM